jgi:hypothetical protein
MLIAKIFTRSLVPPMTTVRWLSRFSSQPDPH